MVSLELSNSDIASYWAYGADNSSYGFCSLSQLVCFLALLPKVEVKQSLWHAQPQILALHQEHN